MSTPATQAALAKAQAANVALSPEERKARSARAAAASAAAAKARKAAPATPAAPVVDDGDSSDLPMRVWLVTLAIEHEGKRAAWTCTASAPTVKRAVREARSLRRSSGKPGAVVAVAGIVDRDFASLAPEQV